MRFLRSITVLLAITFTLSGSTVAGTTNESLYLTIWRMHNRIHASPPWFTDYLKAAKSRGFNVYCTDVPWSTIEKRPGLYNFSKLDLECSHVVKLGFKLIIKINTSTLASTKVPKTWEFPSHINESDYMVIPDGSVYYREKKHTCGPVLSFTNPGTVAKIVKFHTDVVHHFDTKFGRHILFYMNSFTPFGETEYMPVVSKEVGINWKIFGTDYSKYAQEAFHGWLEKRYGSVNKLNDQWGTSYESFDKIRLQEANLTDHTYFRADMLGNLLKKFSDATHSVSKTAKYAAQFGSIFDLGSYHRGTWHAGYWEPFLDWVIVDDAPDYDHNYSMDLTRTIMNGKPFSNEVDGFKQVGATNDRYLMQALQSYHHGAVMVDLANWEGDINKGIGNRTEWSFIDEAAKVVESGTRKIIKPTVAMYVSLAEQYTTSVAGRLDRHKIIYDLYNFLSKGGTEPVDILTDGTIETRPDCLMQYTDGIYVSRFNEHIADDVFEILAGSNAPVFVEDAGCGKFNEYARERIGLKLGRIDPEKFRSTKA